MKTQTFTESPRVEAAMDSPNDEATEFGPVSAGIETESVPVGLSQTFAEIWGGQTCQIQVVGSELVITLGGDYPYVMRFCCPETSEECREPLETLLASVISEIVGQAYQMGRKDAKRAMMDVV